MTVEELLDKINISDIYDAFASVTFNLIRKNQEDYCLSYFINYLSPNDLLKLQDKEPSEILIESKNKYTGLTAFIYDNLNKLCKETYACFDINDISDSFNKDLFEKFNLTELFNNELLTDYLYILLDSNKYKIIQKVNELHLIDNIISPAKIKKLKDNIGDTTILSDRLDYDNRDSVFVDIDGKILIGNKGQSHTQVLQSYLDTISDNKLNDKWVRPKKDELNEKFNNEYCIFGHILDNNLFIENPDISIDKIISDIEMNEISYNKIYEYKNDNITRIAKVIK